MRRVHAREILTKMLTVPGEANDVYPRFISNAIWLIPPCSILRSRPEDFVMTNQPKQGAVVATAAAVFAAAFFGVAMHATSHARSHANSYTTANTAAYAIAAGGHAVGASGYHLSKTIPVGGEGFWDYATVDTDARRLYVSHGTHVVVLDADTQAVV